MSVKMTKADLLAAIEKYPDDAPVVVAIGVDPSDVSTNYEWLGRNPVVWSVSSNTDVIVLEL